MNIEQSRMISLADIEGKVSPHSAQVRGALKMRAEALSYVKDVAALAAYLGGKVEHPGLGEDWAVSKEIFPGVSILFVFNTADAEFPARVRALFSGSKIRTVQGDELATITISCANQLLRYVRESNPGTKLPEVCYKV